MQAIHHAREFDPVAINGSGQVIATNGWAWILWQAGSVRFKGPGEATALNERGQVTIADSDGVTRIWDKGRATRLPLLPGDDGGVALALNEQDQIVGLSGREDMTDPHDRYWKCHAVMWTWQPT